jgi:hypothetical protein
MMFRTSGLELVELQNCRVVGDVDILHFAVVAVFDDALDRDRSRLW